MGAALIGTLCHEQPEGMLGVWTTRQSLQVGVESSHAAAPNLEVERLDFIEIGPQTVGVGALGATVEVVPGGSQASVERLCDAYATVLTVVPRRRDEDAGCIATGRA